MDEENEKSKNNPLHSRRKIIISTISVFIVLTSFFLINFFKSDEIETGTLVIEQESHYWQLYEEKDHGPLLITLYVRNKSDEYISGKAKFKIQFKSSGLEKSFFDAIFKIYDEHSFETTRQSDKPKAIAFMKFLDRGKKFAPGENYEPIKNFKQEKYYTTYVTEVVSFDPGETKKLIITVVHPKYVSGHLTETSQ